MKVLLCLLVLLFAQFATAAAFKTDRNCDDEIVEALNANFDRIDHMPLRFIPIVSFTNVIGSGGTTMFPSALVHMTDNKSFRSYVVVVRLVNLLLSGGHCYVRSAFSYDDPRKSSLGG